MDERSLAFFRECLGDQYVLTEKGDLRAYGTDWTKDYEPAPSTVLLPGSTEDVSAVLRYCSGRGIAVVPSGGRTGLAAGAVAPNGEVVLSLGRMNRIESIDIVGMSVKAEAGVTLQALQEAARDAGLFFPLDLAAKGSCQIGGNLATNAGGVKLIRYGGARELLLGLEVVLPTGEVLDMNTALRKNNTGYDLRQLFVGSEGTLGVITRATLKLMPAPRNVQVSIMAVESFGRVLEILRECNLQGAPVTAFEFFTREAHEIVLAHATGARSPFAELAPVYVLLEVEEGEAGQSVMEPLLESIFEKGLIEDAVLASSSAQAAELWGLRENITESIAAHGQVRKNDISLARGDLGAFIVDLEDELKNGPEGIDLILFGHIGDGNLHINYVAPTAMPSGAFQAKARAFEMGVFELVSRYRGSISAEHGIGLLKKKDLGFSRTPLEIDLMRRLKQVFDPKGILNPGKIFDQVAPES